MVEWFTTLEFEKNPYEIPDPTKIEDKYLGWDRPDLPEAKKTLDAFIDAVANGRRVGLRIFGQSGSGKTWLARVIQVELLKKQPSSILFYSKVPKVEPTFAIVYRIAIENFLKDYLSVLAETVKKRQGGTDNAHWSKEISDPDLANALSRISSNIDAPLAREWLIGGRVSATDLNRLKISASIDTDYDRLSMLKRLLKEMGSIFPIVVLTIDELENAPNKLAPALGDSMRELIDEFSGKFGIICLFTAEKEEIWFDYGYSQALARRLDYTIGLESLKSKDVAEFLRLHQAKYRKQGSRVPDQLLPFSKVGSEELLMEMPVGENYPSYYLVDCGIVARAHAESGASGPIDSQFVKKALKRT